MNYNPLKILAVLALLWLAQPALAFESFTIREIRTEGLQRLEVGTLLSYLPLSVGDELNDQTSRQAIRALYASGLFQNVELLRDGNALIVRVTERPAISSFSIKGNEKIGGEKLKDSLKDLGLTEGEPFKRELLDQVQQELHRQYYANGYYDVDIDTQVKEEPNNRVSLAIKVTEGKITHIKDINIIGNKAFTTEQLLSQLKLEKTTWVPFQRSNRYSKQQLLGDLESLQSYYQDRGYLKFNVASVQVALSPDKQEIYITVNVEEGEVYKIKNYRFSGETVLNQNFLDSLTTTPAGSTFSRKEATESANRIEAALADIGYAFAKVTPLPEVDEEKREVGLNYYIESGKRAYVRRINFSGHSSTNDETLRREMRQLEAAPFSKSSIERSRVRLTRLAFIEEAEVETKPVPGSDDLVDVNFSIRQRPPGSIQFGIGYSGASGFALTGSVSHTNFLGTGDRVSLQVDNTTISRSLGFSWTDPYFTEDGISQTVSASYRKSSALVRSATGLNFNVIGLDLTYGIPLSEYSILRAGFGVQETALTTFPFSSSDEILQFVVENGARYSIYELHTGFARDTRNRTIFAEKGSLNQFDFDFVLPGSDLQYYKVFYRYEQYIPLLFSSFMEFDGSLGLLDSYGSAGEAPPTENFFAGGPRTVRGYREGSLGPRDHPFDNPYGGHFRTSAQANLVIPTPLQSDSKSTRFALFFDIGNVFARPNDFHVNELRRSAGLSFMWFTPFLGILDLSYGFPLNAQPTDFVDRFQINFRTPF